MTWCNLEIYILYTIYLIIKMAEVRDIKMGNEWVTRIECRQSVIIAALFSLVHRIKRIRPLNNACGQEYCTKRLSRGNM